MVFSKKYNFLFFAIPKTASTSIRSILVNYREKLNLNNFSHLIQYDPLHINQQVAKQIFTEAGIYFKKNTFEFVFVRNPYDKVRSHISYVQHTKYNHINFNNIDSVLDTYENNIHHNKWFENDQRYYNFCLQSVWTKNPISNNFHVFKVEEIDSSWNKIKNHLNLELPELPHINKSTKNVVFSKSQKDRIYDIFKSDFELFGYDK
jgi:hypothetical protein